MPARKDFSGGVSDLPLELHRPNQLLDARNCYWARRLKKWKSAAQVPGLSMPNTLAVHPYISLHDGDAITLFVRFVADHAEVWAYNHTTPAAAEKVGADFWSGATAQQEVWTTALEQGVVIGGDGQWPIVVTEDDGVLGLRTLDSYDVRNRDSFDIEVGFARNTSDPTDMATTMIPNVFREAVEITRDYGVLTATTEPFQTWEQNIIWVASLFTFNRIDIRGDGLPAPGGSTGGQAFLVDKEGNFTGAVAALQAGEDPTKHQYAEWDWDAVYAQYNAARDLPFSPAATVGEGQYRAFVWWPGPDTLPAPLAPTLTATPENMAARVAWQAVPYAEAYESRYKVTSANDNTYSAWAETTALFVEIESLTNNTEYTVQVRAKNTVSGTAQYSSPSSVDVTPESGVVAPGVPTISFDGHDIVITRGAAGGEPASYRVRYREGTAGGFLVATTTTGRFTTNVDGVLQAEAQAINVEGTSDYSPRVQRVARPSGIIASVGTAQINTFGGGVTGATDYDNRVRIVGTQAWTEDVDPNDFSSNSMQITGLQSGETYELQTRARNGNGPGPWSATVVTAPIP